MKKELKSFEKFLKLVRSHVYSEPETELHSNTINAMSKKIVNEHFIDPTAKLLDIGCGSGYAMDRLRELGMQADDLDQVVQLAVQNPYWNPRAIGPESATALRALLQRAWEGQAPASSDA